MYGDYTNLEKTNQNLINGMIGPQRNPYVLAKKGEQTPIGPKTLEQVNLAEKEKIISDAEIEFENFRKNMATELEEVGAMVSDAWESFLEFVEDIWNGVQSIVATVVNCVIALLEGVYKIIEYIVDAVAILGTAVDSVITGAIDGVTYVIALMDGNTESWSSLTADMWKNTMSFVAEDYIGTYVDDFYEMNKIGQWLNSKSLVKSDGTIANIITGIGEVLGIIAISIALPGVGSAATGVGTLSSVGVTAGVAATAGMGRTTEKSWAEKRDASWEGIEREWKAGRITDEQYNSYIMIRGMSEDAWKEIEEEYKQGKIDKVQFEAMKNIREMPEDWKTAENAAKGIFKGVAVGTWEGIQWYVGGKLGSIVFKEGNKVLNSTLRVTADTAMNSMDTPARTIIDFAVENESWEEAWIKQGGWTAVLTSVGVGLVGSAGSEVLGEAAEKLSKNGIKNIDNISVKQIEQVSDINKNNLVDSIISDLPKKLDDEAKMRAIYLKLNESVSYSDEFFALNNQLRAESNMATKAEINKTLNQIYSKEFNIRNMSTNKVVCSTWADIYKQLLEEAGIKPNKIQIVQAENGAHRWVQVEYKNKVLIADATENLNIHTDLARAKMGIETNGFIITTKKELEEIQKNVTDSNQIKKILYEKCKGDINKIDAKIGYSGADYNKNLTKIFNMYENTKNNAKISEKLKITSDIINSKEYTAVEAYPIIKEKVRLLFNEENIEFSINAVRKRYNRCSKNS